MSGSAAASCLKRSAPATTLSASSSCISSGEADFECIICADVLLDPVVAPLCGHDFCCRCYHAWVRSCALAGTPAACPLCRSGPLPPTLAVCLRLRDMTERVRSKDVQRRRLEMSDSSCARDFPPPQASIGSLEPVPGWPVASQAMLAAMTLAMHSSMAGAMYPAWQQPVNMPEAGSQSPLTPEQNLPSAPQQPDTAADAAAATLASCDRPGATCTTPSMRQPVPAACPTDWHADVPSAERLAMARHIIRVLLMNGVHKSLGARLPDAVRLLELMLFRAAPSKNAYLDPSDLESRIAMAVRSRLDAARARRQRLASAASAAAPTAV